MPRSFSENRIKAEIEHNRMSEREDLLRFEGKGKMCFSIPFDGGAGTLQDVAGSYAASESILHLPLSRRIPNRIFTLATCLIAALLLLCVVVFGVVLEPAAMQTDLLQKNLPPSMNHIFGTDNLGRDMFIRTISGLSTSVRIGVVAALVSAVIALVLGFAAALGPRKVDTVITWVIDLMLSIPHIVLLILISYAIGKGFWGVSIGVALTHWPTLARVVRAEVMQVKNSGYVAVSEKLGATPLDIAKNHMFPAVFPQFITGVILLFPHAILHEAAVTFLGFGLPPEVPAIGVILSESMGYLSLGMWWLAVFPGIALLLVVLLFDFVGQRVRRLMDPSHVQE